MAKFVVSPATPEALRQEFLNDIMRRIDWLEAGAGARKASEQIKVRSAINELNLLLKFWQGVVIEPQPAPRVRSRRSGPMPAPQPEETKS